MVVSQEGIEFWLERIRNLLMTHDFWSQVFASGWLRPFGNVNLESHQLNGIQPESWRYRGDGLGVAIILQTL